MIGIFPDRGLRRRHFRGDGTTSGVARPDASTAGVWPRTAAFLARQALEEAVNARWAADPVTEPMRHASIWSRLTCLPAYMDEVARHSPAEHKGFPNISTVLMMTICLWMPCVG